MKDKCLEHLLTLAEAGRVLRNGILKDAAAWEDFEVELIRAEDYLSSIYFPNRDVAIANLRKHRSAPTLPPIQGCPHTPTKRVVLPAPRKSKLTFDQIQNAVRKVSRKNKNKL